MKAALLLSLGFGIAFGSTAQAQGKDPPGVNPTHFQCYRVSQQKPIRAEAKVVDQFGGASYKLGKALFLCAPASKNGEPVKDKETHLTCYSIPAKNAAKKVVVRHQFGEQLLKVGGSVTLCLPSLKKVL